MKFKVNEKEVFASTGGQPFNKNNPLSKLGKVNFHIDSDQYNFIEMSHHIILVYLVDIFAKNKLSS